MDLFYWFHAGNIKKCQAVSKNEKGYSEQSQAIPVAMSQACRKHITTTLLWNLFLDTNRQAGMNNHVKTNDKIEQLYGVVMMPFSSATKQVQQK